MDDEQTIDFQLEFPNEGVHGQNTDENHNQRHDHTDQQARLAIIDEVLRVIFQKFQPLFEDGEEREVVIDEERLQFDFFHLAVVFEALDDTVEDLVYVGILRYF